MYEYHLSNITCSARLRQKLYNSDDIHFFHFYDICMVSLQYSEVWGRRVKTLRTPGLDNEDDNGSLSSGYTYVFLFIEKLRSHFHYFMITLVKTF